MKEQLLYWVTQENSIEISLQTNLPYILLLMVHAHYCVPYPKWPCIEHEINMWYLCCVMSFLDPSTMFSVSHDLTLTLCSKNRKITNKSKKKIKMEQKNKKKQSPLLAVLTVMMHLNTNIFLFLLSVFLNLILLFFWFYF